MNKLIKQIVESKFNFNIDIKDNKMQSSLSKSKYNSISLKELYDLEQYTVDLGLPSRTLWSKYNLGCDYDFLNNHLEDTKPSDWYGDYYAWGEIETKNEYTWDNYKHISIRSGEEAFHKYGEDHVMTLLLEDDAAYLNLHIGNLKFKIPSKELFEELVKNTTSKWVENYNDIKGLNGRLLKSKFNENEIFFPFAGVNEKPLIYEKSKLIGAGSAGFVWTSTAWTSTATNSNSSRSWYVIFDIESISIWHNDKYIGCSIHPILFNK